MNRSERLSDIQNNDIYYFRGISEEMLARINKTSTIAFNDLLQEMNLCEILISPLTFEIPGYSLKNLPDTIRLLNELGEISYDDNLIAEKSLLNFFKYLIINAPELEVRFQKLCQKIKEKRPLIYSLNEKNGELLFLESGAVTGSVRLLVFPEEIVLLTLSGYD